MNTPVGTFIYSYRDDKWRLVSVTYWPEVCSDSYSIRRRLNDHGRYEFPASVDAPLKSFIGDQDVYSVTTEDGFKWPEVVTLEQSIENNRKLLRSYLK